MWWLIQGLLLLVLGVLGAANLIIARRPDAEKAISKLSPYEGWLGTSAAIIGIFWIIRAVRGIGLLAYSPISWLLYTASAVVCLLLGVLLGVGVIKSFIKNENANAKLDHFIAKLAPYKGRLGIAAIALGLWAIFWRLAWV